MLPQFSRNVKKTLRQIYENNGRTAMQSARKLLTPEDYQTIQNFRKQQSFTFTQALLHILNSLSEIPKCKNPSCSNDVSFGRKGAKTEYKIYCSTKCANSDEGTREKTKQTCRKLYGVDNISQSEVIKQRKIDTCMENHGVEHPSQSRKVRRKITRSVREHYGVDNVSQSKEVLKSKKRTWLDKYGYDNPSKSPEIKRLIGRKVHSSIAKKKIVNGHGKKYILQGYEPQALNYLKKYFRYAHIHSQSSGKVPNFEYYFEGRDRMYFPDFLVQTEDYECIVEVKSIYTLCETSAKYRMMKAKAKAVLGSGYDLELLVMQSDGTKIEIPSDWHCLTYRQFKTLLPPDRRR